MIDNDSECLMASGDGRVNISVTDRILLHLWEQDHQADEGAGCEVQGSGKQAPQRCHLRGQL